MLFNHKEYLAIYRYFRDRLDYSVCSSFHNTYNNHLLFGQTLLDKFAIFAGKHDIFDVCIEGKEYFMDMLNSNKGAIVVSAHVGNFELSGYLLKQNIKPVNAIIFGGEAEVMQRYRESSFMGNVKPIPLKEDMSHVFLISDAILNGEVINMLSDRAHSMSKSLKYSFLGAEASFPTGAFNIASKFDLKVLAIFMLKEGFGHYKLYVKPISVEESDEKSSVDKAIKIDCLTKKFVLELESIVKTYPTQWFNFYNFWNDNQS